MGTLRNSLQKEYSDGKASVGRCSSHCGVERRKRKEVVVVRIVEALCE